MMLRRGTGGFYVNGLVSRWPRGAISIRDTETFTRAGSVATPDLGTADLAVKNVLIAESALAFQTGTGQNAFDMAGNAIVQDAAATTAIFTAFPASFTTTTTASAIDSPTDRTASFISLKLASAPWVSGRNASDASCTPLTSPACFTPCRGTGCRSTSA